MTYDRPMRRVLLTHGDAFQEPLLALVVPVLAAYADRHGYELHVDRRHGPGGRSAHWAKVEAMRELLDDSDLLLWVDNDLLLRASSEDVAAHLHPLDDQALCMEQTVHGPGPNTGLWLLRPSARSFLDAVWDTGQLPDARLHDQATVAHLLGWSYLPHLTRPIAPSAYASRCGWLDPRWNVLVCERERSARTSWGLHYGGMATTVKAALMRQRIIDDRLPGWRALLDAEALATIETTEWEHPDAP